MKRIFQHILAAAEPVLAAVYWITLCAKSALEDEQACQEGKYQ